MADHEAGWSCYEALLHVGTATPKPAALEPRSARAAFFQGAPRTRHCATRRCRRPELACAEDCAAGAGAAAGAAAWTRCINALRTRLNWGRALGRGAGWRPGPAKARREESHSRAAICVCVCSGYRGTFEGFGRDEVLCRREKALQTSCPPAALGCLFLICWRASLVRYHNLHFHLKSPRTTYNTYPTDRKNRLLHQIGSTPQPTSGPQSSS